jgi:hypothetical protein
MRYLDPKTQSEVSSIMSNEHRLSNDGSSSENEGADQDPVASTFSSDLEDIAVMVPSTIKTVWETRRLEKIVDKGGHKM